MRDFSGPEPDARAALGVTFDAEGRPQSMTYGDLFHHASRWPTTSATPQGSAALLAPARESFALGIYHYELFAVAATWSLMAVEASLREHYQGDKRNLIKLIDQAHDDGLVDEAWADRLHTGRKLRNTLIHATRAVVWSPGMASDVIVASHKVVARIFPDVAPAARLPLST